MGKRGGGLALYVKNGITGFQVPDNLETNDVECLWINVLTDTLQDGVLVGVCYTPLNHTRE